MFSSCVATMGSAVGFVVFRASEMTKHALNLFVFNIIENDLFGAR